MQSIRYELLPVIGGLAVGILTIVVFSLMSPVAFTTTPIEVESCSHEMRPSKAYAAVSLLSAGALHSIEPVYEPLDPSVLARHPEILQRIDKADLCSTAIDVPAYSFVLSNEQADRLVSDPEFHFGRFTGELAGSYFYSNFTYNYSPYRLYIGFGEDRPDLLH